MQLLLQLSNSVVSRLCCSAEQVRDLAAKMLGNRLITNQTGPEGQLVKKVNPYFRWSVAARRFGLLDFRDFSDTWAWRSLTSCVADA